MYSEICAKRGSVRRKISMLRSTGATGSVSTVTGVTTGGGVVVMVSITGDTGISGTTFFEILRFSFTGKK